MLYVMEMKIKLWISKQSADVKIVSGYSDGLRCILCCGGLCSAGLNTMGSHTFLGSDLVTKNNFKSDIAILTDFYKKQIMLECIDSLITCFICLKLFKFVLNRLERNAVVKLTKLSGSWLKSSSHLLGWGEFPQNSEIRMVLWGAREGSLQQFVCIQSYPYF